MKKNINYWKEQISSYFSYFEGNEIELENQIEIFLSEKFLILKDTEAVEKHFEKFSGLKTSRLFTMNFRIRDNTAYELTVFYHTDNTGEVECYTFCLARQ